MGNLATTIKRFITNKNTVTILAVIAGIIVLWYFYTYRVNQAITTIEIPYAVERIDSSDKIEIDKIQYKEITASTLNDSDMITDTSFLEGKYICPGNSIPTNGFFYKSQICEKEQLPNTIFESLAEGETLYTLPINSRNSYANRLTPGKEFVLYMRTKTNDNKSLSGPLFEETIKILSVTDSSGNDVVWDSEAGESAYLLFIVNEEDYNLLMAAEDLGVELYPVIMGGTYTPSIGETYTTSENLQYFIKNNISR